MRTIISSFITLIILLPLPINAQTLVDAVLKSDTLMMLNMIHEGADPNTLDEDGITPLMIASRLNDTSAVRLLLANKAIADKSSPDKGRTPLMIACAYYGGKTVCKLLVENGANVNAVSNSGKTALMFAAKNGKVDVVEYLLSVGADASKKDIAGFTAFDCAQYPDINILQTLRSMNQNISTEDVLAKLKSAVKL